MDAMLARHLIWWQDGAHTRSIRAESDPCHIGCVWRLQVDVVGEVGRVRAKGVVLRSGESVESEVVVCNADLPYAEKSLLPESVARSFEVRVDRSVGAVSRSPRAPVRSTAPGPLERRYLASRWNRMQGRLCPFPE